MYRIKSLYGNKRHAKQMGMGLSGPSLCYWSSTTASYYIVLVSNNYVPNETHVYASAISGAEVSDPLSFTSGYNGTARIQLTARTVTVNLTSHQVEFGASTITWSAINAGTAHAFVVLQQVTNNANSPLITYNSLGGFPITTNGTNLTLSVTSAGLFAGIDF